MPLACKARSTSPLTLYLKECAYLAHGCIGYACSLRLCGHFMRYPQYEFQHVGLVNVNKPCVYVVLQLMRLSIQIPEAIDCKIWSKERLCTVPDFPNRLLRAIFNSRAAPRVTRQLTPFVSADAVPRYEACSELQEKPCTVLRA